MTDAREALDRIKAREEARGYAVAHEDREAVRLTTIESQKDVGPLTEALEAVLSIEPEDLSATGKQEHQLWRAFGWNEALTKVIVAIETNLSEEET